MLKITRGRALYVGPKKEVSKKTFESFVQELTFSLAKSDEICKKSSSFLRIELEVGSKSKQNACNPG
jgi:hypothetical protein